MSSKKEEFERELEAILTDAKNKGHEFKIVNAGELHRKVGGYPNSKSHNMPGCCNVMGKRMNKKDRIVKQPPKGNGASLTIQYCLID